MFIAYIYKAGNEKCGESKIESIIEFQCNLKTISKE